MGKYLLFETREPFGGSEAPSFLELAAALARAENQVTVFLVENGVLGARVGARTSSLEALTRAGVEVLADEFSLRERGLGADRLAPTVKPVPLEVVVDRLAEGSKALWH